MLLRRVVEAHVEIGQPVGSKWLAEREGVPLGTMKSWIRRAMQRLRGCLEQ